MESARGGRALERDDLVWINSHAMKGRRTGMHDYVTLAYEDGSKTQLQTIQLSDEMRERLLQKLRQLAPQAT